MEHHRSQHDDADFLPHYLGEHGDEGKEHIKFAGFLGQHDLEALRRYRRHVEALERDPAFPTRAVSLLFLHLYSSTVVNEAGIRFYTRSAREESGVSKQQLLDTITYAFLEAGPGRANAMAAADESFRVLSNAAPARPITWPRGWTPDPAAFRSGIDHSSDDLLPGEIEKLEAWHRRMYGGDARVVRLLAGLQPRAYKTSRIRYEQSIGTALPAQMYPLYTLHLATVHCRVAAMRAAIHMARELGVSREAAGEVVWWGFLYGSETLPHETADAIADLLK